MRKKVAAAAQACGFLALTAGFALFSVPLALIVAGLVALAAGEVHGR